MTTEIWHNPKCSKSRETLALVEDKLAGAPLTVRRYLEDPPDAADLERVLALLGLAPRELMRKDEDEYAALGLADPAKTRAELVAAMVSHPRLIQRPVVIHAGRAALGRPPERVLDLF